MIVTLGNTGRILPGFAAALAIAIIAVLVGHFTKIAVMSPLILAVLVGMVAGNIYRLPKPFHKGLSFSSRTILRFAIGLLGLQLSVAQIAAVGVEGVLVVVCVVAITFIGISWIGILVGIDAKLACLLAAGTSICGASAVAAMSTVNQASEEDVTYAMATVTAFGTVLMFFLPAAGHWLELNAAGFGVWAGASIHEVAQVTGAAFQFSESAGETGVIIKLMRVLMLAPLILAWSVWSRSRSSVKSENASVPEFPIFVLGFIAAVVVNSMIPIPVETRATLMGITTFLMSVALAALGLQTNFSKLTAKGVAPLMLGAFGTILIVSLSAGLIIAMGGFI